MIQNKRLPVKTLFFLTMGLLSSLFLTKTCRGQYALPENNVWAFGEGIGLDFNPSGSNPTTIATNINLEGTVTVINEATASICDVTGQLLFYTNGSRVWNRNDVVMPNNINGLHGGTADDDMMTQSTTQGAIIVPMPDSPSKYYVFSLTGFQGLQTSATGELFYSVVDMDLDGGMGDIVPGQKWIELDSALTEKMVAIQGTQNNVWIVTHTLDSNLFKAFNVTACGIDPNPVISSVGFFDTLFIGGMTPHSFFFGTGAMVANNAGTKLVICNTDSKYSALFNFDKSTGTVSNEIPLNNQHEWYSAAFSPDDSKLYVANIGYMHTIYQYDLNAPSASQLLSTFTSVSDLSSSQLRLGPDGKIYYRSYPGHSNSIYLDFMGRIENPNAQAFNLQFTQGIVQFPDTNEHKLRDSWFLGMGNFIVKADPSQNQPQIMVRYDTLTCFDSTLTLNGTPNMDSYLWDNGATSAQRVINQAGTYWVKGLKNCQQFIDTFQITEDYKDYSFSLGDDTTICQPNHYILRAPSIFGAGYTWQDGSGGAGYTASTTGDYWVTLNVGSCSASDTIHLDFIKVEVIASGDTNFCYGDPIDVYINAVASTGATMTWNTGETSTNIHVADTGLFVVTAQLKGCQARDSVHIGNKFCECDLHFPNAFTPNGDGLNDEFGAFVMPCEMARYELVIFNRYGQVMFRSANPQAKWNGTYNGKKADAGTYFYKVHYLPFGASGEMIRLKGDITLIR